MKFYYLLVLMLLIPFSFAHEEGTEKNLDHILRDNSVLFVTVGSIIVILTIAASFLMHESNHHWPYFATLVITVAVTLYLVIGTLHLNFVSETKGPVHWHADFEIYKCGERINLEDPKGLSNKIGNPVFHEHSDDRMHVEGVVVEKEHVSLSEFIGVIGGKMESGYFEVPVNKGNATARDGEYCGPDESRLQVFLYRVTNPDPTKKSGFIYEKTKLVDYEDYILSPYFNVPPGDCFIIEFGPEKETTDRICETYRIAIEKGELSGS